ncbi:hypothetical protein KIN20_005284 [Parelaphostrongylus tenuis]|uniref:Transmembrane protein 234 n=1 Tax=Parelaphostrongylus tenuis TaxID=148309 RepID=A0AAD5QJZ4_PARTN|nr:hypothetical protein KIN20_005284 [Parelaphostrongylus tenuis]
MRSSSTCSMECILSILIVAFFWGATNPLLRLGSRRSAKGSVTPTNVLHQVLTPFKDLTALFLNWRFSLPFIVNQSASIMFIYLVSIFPVSVIVPCVNALQFVFTAIVGQLIGERILSRRKHVGIWAVNIGVLIMMVSDANETLSPAT